MSFSIATSGLNAITKSLDAISNNIANAETAGYKGSRAEFSAMYAQGQPLGVGISRVSQSISSQGNLLKTGNNLDLAIAGGGFFIVKDSAGGEAYTRAGYFGTDDEGYLISNLGMRLQGYSVDGSNNLQAGSLGDLQILSGTIPAKATDKLDFTANLSSKDAVPEKPFNKDDRESYNNTYTTNVYDSQGGKHTMTQYFVKTGDNQWESHYYLDDKAMDPASTTLTFNEKGAITAPADAVTLKFDGLPGVEALNVELNYSGTTQFGNEFAVSQNKATGYEAGQKTGQQVDEDGKVYATYSNGQRMLQGQLVLANFMNPDGLSPQSGTTWTQSADSGAPIIGAPGTGLMGKVQSGTLESSTVDMTAELVNLMTSQRNYQANTKVISTNDQMTSALFQAI